ncbi:MAG: hypothetical protein PHW73_10880 [Atribacterota bacterium]|nr:hypothetical protein [Atribacterota bacterium]
MTKEEFDQLPSDINMPWEPIEKHISCPLCGSYETHPTPNCQCNKGNSHIMKYHHTCGDSSINYPSW